VPPLAPILPVLADFSDAPSIIFRSLVLIVLVVAGFYAIMRVRRWLKEEDEPDRGIGFSLSDFRELHRRGEMSTEEFEKLKSLMLSAGKSMTKGIDPLARPNSSTPRRPSGPHA
jgi:hypothetical protein